MGLLKASFSDGVYIPNSDFTSQGIKNWIPYKGSAVVVPINEIYTNPNFVSIKSTDLNPLIGSQSGVITKTSGNALGEGVYTEFFVDEGLRSQVLQISFYYKTLGDYNNHIKVYVYDTVNNIVIYPNMIDVFTSPSSSLHTALITLNINCGKYRLYFHVASSSTQAFQLQLNNIEIKKNEVLGGAAVGATQTYPLTIGATTTAPTKGTVITDIATWTRKGDRMVLFYAYEQSTGGNAGSGTYVFPLPPGYSIDLLRVPIGSTVGTCKVLAPTISEAIGVVVVEGASLLRMQYVAPTGAEVTIPVGSSGYGLTGARRYGYVAEVPIAQWTSNVNLASDFQEFAFNTQAAINTNDTTSFGYGSDGTPILANTAVTFYDVAFQKPFQATDKYSIELRSKVDGAWVDIAEASVPSLYIPGFAGIAYTNSANNMFLRNITLARVAANKIRVLFGDGINGGTSSWSGTPVVARGWAQIVAAADGYDRWRVRKISNGNMAESIPNLNNNGYIFGLTLSNNVTTPLSSLDIRRGKASSSLDFNNPFLMTLNQNITKSINGTWVAGNNQNGLDTGAKAANTWYGVFLISNRQNTDVIISASSIPILPSGYIDYRRIGYIKTDASSNILGFTQNNDYFYFKDIQIPIDNIAIATTPTLYNLGVPHNSIAKGVLNAGACTTSGSLAISIASGLGNGQTAVNQTNGATSGFRGLVGGSHASGSFSADLKVWASYFEVQTDNLGRAYLSRAGSYSSGGSTVQLHGWTDYREKE